MKKILNILIISLSLIIIFPNISLAKWEYDVLDLPQFKINNQIPVKIALIDSGVIDNDYLRPYIYRGYNFLDNNENIIDTYGHGTKVSGILVDLAMETDLNIQLIPLKTVNSEGRSSTINVIRAINYSIEQNVDIINISMANKTNDLELFSTIQNAQKNNIIIVAGVGNNGQNIELYPASYNNVISVGSIDKTQNISWFSNYNDKINVVAPGEKITTIELDGSYGIHSGTSFSTPFVTFEVALLKAKYPELNNEQIIKIINKTAIDKGEVGFDNYYGNGIVSYNNAINNFDKTFQEYLNWKTYSDVALDKSWAINFNDNVKTIDNVYLMDEYYNIFPTISKINDNKVIISPISNYKDDTIYSLIISDVISTSNVKLKNNIKMKFKTIKTNNLNYINRINIIDTIPDEIPY